MRVEVQEAEWPEARGTRAHVRFRDRVVAAEDDRDQARVDDLADEGLDCVVRSRSVGGEDGRIAEVDDAECGERIHLRLEMRSRGTTRGADRARAEACAGPVGDEIVHRRADDRDVEVT